MAAKKQSKSGSKPKRSAKAKKYSAYLKRFPGGTAAAYKKYAKKYKAAGKPKKAAKKKKAKSKKPKARKPAKRKASAHETKKPKAKKNKAKKAKKRKQPDVASQITRNKAALANIQSRYETKLQAEKTKLAKAEGEEKARIIRRLENLVKQRDAELDRVRKQQERSMWRERDLQAAEKKKSKKRKKAKRRNPITGWGESAATVGGVVVGGLLLVLGDAWLSTRGNIQGTGAAMVDQPVGSSGVYAFEAQNLPVWKNFKHAGGFRILWALANTAGPLAAAHFANKGNHKKLAAFLDGWGYTDVGITAVKVSTDGLAMMLKGKAFGLKVLPAQIVALNATAAASAGSAPLVAASIGPGSAGGLGYTATAGSPPNLGAGSPGCEHVGAGAPCCSSCASKGPAAGRPQTGNVPGAYPPGNNIPAPSGTPSNGTVTPGGTPTGNPGGTPRQVNTNTNPGPGTTPGGLSVTGAPIGAQGADNVVSIKHPAFASRIPQRKSFSRKYG